MTMLLRRVLLPLLFLASSTQSLALTSFCNIGPVTGGYDTIYHLGSWTPYDALDPFDYVDVQSTLTAPFYAHTSSGQEAGQYGGSLMHPLPDPDDGYHAATGYINMGSYAFDSCSVAGYIDNIPNTTPVEIDAFSGSNTLQSGILTIRQDDELELQVLADGPLVCTVVAGSGSAQVEIAAGSNGTGHRFPAYAFDVGTSWVSASCPGADPNGFELEVLTPINPAPTTPAAAITSASLTTLGNVNLNGQSFTSDTPVKVSWTTTNASACYLRHWNLQQYPTQNTGTTLPAGHFDVGDYEFSFFCAGEGGVSSTEVFEFEVLAPSGNPSTEPGFRGEYEATVGNVNNDGKPDIRIKPASGNTDTGVVEFVLVSNPSSPGYQVLGPQSISWGSVSTTIDLLLGDFDADGLEDLIIKNISGADDVIVYAPRLAEGRPRDYVEVDQQFRTFFEELYGQIVDPDYFDNNTYTEVQDYYYWLDYDIWGPCAWGFEWSSSGFIPTACSMPMFPGGWGGGIGMNSPIMVLERSVRLYRIYRMENGDVDYRDFHPATNLLRGVFRNSFNTGILQTGELEAGSWQAASLSDTVSGVIKRSFMAGDLYEQYSVSSVVAIYQLKKALTNIWLGIMDDDEYEELEETWGNTWGPGFEARAAIYQSMHEEIENLEIDTVWFEAASELNQFIAGAGWKILDNDAREFFHDLGVELLDYNQDIFEDVINGVITYTGQALDDYLVEQEQAFVESFILDRYPPPEGVPWDVNLWVNGVFYPVVSYFSLPDNLYEALEHVKQQEGYYDYWEEDHRVLYGKKIMQIKRGE